VIGNSAHYTARVNDRTEATLRSLLLLAVSMINLERLILSS
jgi:hypothetical protein